MKKAIVVVMLLAVLFAPSMGMAAKDPAAAGLLSAMLPGCGEWYNKDWNGSFPVVECAIGYICCLFQVSSVMDAVNGATSDTIRFDFWSVPGK